MTAATRNGATSGGRQPLRKAHRLYADGCLALTAIDAGTPRADAGRLCHSLRGACATVGATALAADIADLERRLAAADADGAALRATGASVHGALQALAAHIAAAAG